MSDTLLNQIMGFVVGILSSWFFWRTLLLVKPKIEISPVLVYDPDKQQLMIKIRNNGNRWVTDVQAKLMLSERYKVNNDIFRTNAIKYYSLSRDSLFALRPKKLKNKPWQSFYTIFTFVAHEECDPVELLSTSEAKERRFEFQLISSDALTGAKHIQSSTYGVSDIKTGIYGREFQVLDKEQGKQDNKITQKEV